MPICKKCNESFPNIITINNKRRNLSSRQYCLNCSPFGIHNTKQIHQNIHDKIKNPIFISERLCPLCKEVKPKDEFYKRSKIYDNPTGYCKSCFNKQCIERQRDIKQKCLDYKGGKCQVCGYNKCALDFHHNKGNKEFNIFEHKCRSMEKQIEELDKCIILCRNCHHEKHFEIREKKYTKQKTIEHNKNDSIRCIKCKKHKPPTEFYNQTADGSKKHPYCKNCLNMGTIQKQRELKKQCVEYKGGKCEKCGYNKYDGALDFHHKNPSEKEFVISKWKNKHFEYVKDELDKCSLLCKNCHYEEHDRLCRENKMVGVPGLEPGTLLL